MTHLEHAGDQVPTDTVLATPDLKEIIYSVNILFDDDHKRYGYLNDNVRGNKSAQLR